MEFIQRVEEKLFRWWKKIEKHRPGSLQDVHLIRTRSQTSITLSVYKQRRRLAREVERETRFQETYNSVKGIFDESIDLNSCQGIAKEAEERKELMDVESSHGGIEDGCLNTDDWSWDEVEWDEMEWVEKKQDSCVEHVEHA
ncbi:hypothetical protein BGAL_0299g00050 [Botrytis galanthina]|uniref:Uncharacterized protein n=1 Tax=Botrytis galanthina TaxID=278940 RepID=A0A4V4HU33_9HELO|nr:hypothetical protein BGAL_0299g00050 [Botrytis galanthina]